MTNDGTVTHTKQPQIVVPSVVQMDGSKAIVLVSGQGHQAHKTYKQIHFPINDHTTVVSPVKPVLSADIKPAVIHDKRPSHLEAASKPQNINILVCPAPCSGRCAGNCPQECCQAQSQIQHGDQSVVVCQRPCINNCSKSCPPPCCSLTQQQVASAEKSPSHTFSYYGNAPPAYAPAAAPAAAPPPQLCQGNGPCSNNQNGQEGVVVSQGQFVIHPNGQVTGSKKQIGNQKKGTRIKIQIVSPYAHLKKKGKAEEVAMKKHHLSHAPRKNKGNRKASVTQASRPGAYERLVSRLTSLKTSIPIPTKRSRVHKRGKSIHKVKADMPASIGSEKRHSLIRKKYRSRKGKNAKKSASKKLKKGKSLKLKRYRGKRVFKTKGRFRRSCECQTVCKKSGISNPKEDGCVTKCSGCPAGYERYRKDELVHKEDKPESKEESLVDTVTDNVDEEEELVDYASEDDDSEETGAEKSKTNKKEVSKKEDIAKDVKGKKTKAEKVVTGTKKEEILGRKDASAVEKNSSDEEEMIEDVPDNEEEGEEIVRDEEENVELMNDEMNKKTAKKRKDEIDTKADDDKEQASKTSKKHKTVTTEDEFGNQEIVESEIVDPSDTSDDERISEGKKNIEKVTASAKDFLPSDNNTVHYNFTNAEEGEETVEFVDGDDVVNDGKGNKFVSDVNKENSRIKPIDDTKTARKEKSGKDESNLKKGHKNDETKTSLDEFKGETEKEEGKKGVEKEDEATIDAGSTEKDKEEAEMSNGKKEDKESSDLEKKKENEEDNKKNSGKNSKAKVVEEGEQFSLESKDQTKSDNKGLEKSDDHEKSLKKDSEKNASDGKKKNEEVSSGDKESEKPAVLSINVEQATPINMDEVAKSSSMKERGKEEDSAKDSNEDNVKKPSEDGKGNAEKKKQGSSTLLGLTSSDLSNGELDDSKGESGQKSELSGASKSGSESEDSKTKSDQTSELSGTLKSGSESEDSKTKSDQTSEWSGASKSGSESEASKVKSDQTSELSGASKSGSESEASKVKSDQTSELSGASKSGSESEASKTKSDQTSELSVKASGESKSNGSKSNEKSQEQSKDLATSKNDENSSTKDKNESSKDASVETRQKSSRDPYADIGSSDSGVDYMKKFADKKDGGKHGEKESLLSDKSGHTESFKENKNITAENLNAESEGQENQENSHGKKETDGPTSILENFKNRGTLSDTGFFMDGQTGRKGGSESSAVGKQKTEGKLSEQGKSLPAVEVKEGETNKETTGSGAENGQLEGKDKNKAENQDVASVSNRGVKQEEQGKQGSLDKPENQEKVVDQEKQKSEEKSETAEKQSYHQKDESTKPSDRDIKKKENAKKNYEDNTVNVGDNANFVRPTPPISLSDFQSESKAKAVSSDQMKVVNQKPASPISLTEFQTMEKRPDEISFQENYGDSENDNKVETDSKANVRVKDKETAIDNVNENSTSSASSNRGSNATEKAKHKGSSSGFTSTEPAKLALSKQAVVNDSKPIDSATEERNNKKIDEKHKAKSEASNKNEGAKDKKDAKQKAEKFSSGSAKGGDKTEEAYKEIGSGNTEEENKEGEDSMQASESNFTPINVFTDVDNNGDLVEVEKDDPDGSIVTMTVDQEGNGEDEEGSEMDAAAGADAKDNLGEEERGNELEESTGSMKGSKLFDDVDDNQDIDAEKEALETYNNDHNENEEMSLDALAKILDDLDKSVDSIRVKNGTARQKINASKAKKKDKNDKTEPKKVGKTDEKKQGKEGKKDKSSEKENLDSKKKNASVKGKVVQGSKKGKQESAAKSKAAEKPKDRKHKPVSNLPSKKLDAENSEDNEESRSDSPGSESTGASDIITDADEGDHEDEAVEVVEPNDVLLFTKDADSRTGDWFEKVVKPAKRVKESKKQKHHAKYSAFEDWNANYEDNDDEALLGKYADEDNEEGEDNFQRDAYSDEDGKKAKESFVAQVSGMDGTMSDDQIKDINKAIMKDDDVQFEHGNRHMETSLFDLPDEEADVTKQVKESSKNTMDKIAQVFKAENRLEDQNSFPDDVVNTKFFSHDTAVNDVDQDVKGLDDMSSDSFGAPLKSLDPLYEQGPDSNKVFAAKPVEEVNGEAKHAIPPNKLKQKKSLKISAEGDSLNGPSSSFDGGGEFLNPEPHVSKSESAKARQAILPKKAKLDQKVEKEKGAKKQGAGKNKLGVLIKAAKALDMQQKAVKGPPVAQKKAPKKGKLILKKVLAKKHPKPAPVQKQTNKTPKPATSNGLKKSGSKLAQLVQQALKPKSSQPISKTQKMQKLNDSLTLIDEMEDQIDKELQKNDTPVVNDEDTVITDTAKIMSPMPNIERTGSNGEGTSSSNPSFSPSPTEQITLKSLLPEYGTESPGMKVTSMSEQPSPEKKVQFPNPQDEQHRQASLVLSDMNSKDHYARLKQAKALLQIQKYEADNALDSVKNIQSKSMDQILKASMDRQNAFVKKIADKYEKDYYAPKTSVEDAPADGAEGSLQEPEDDPDRGVYDNANSVTRVLKMNSDDSLPALDTDDKDDDDDSHAVIVQKDGISEVAGDSADDSAGDSAEDSAEDSENEDSNGLEERDLEEKDVEKDDDLRIREMTNENEDDESENEDVSNSDKNENNVDDGDDDDDD